MNQAMAFASATSSAKATDDALEQIREQLKDRLPGPADLVVIFATAHHASNLGTIGQAMDRQFGPQRCLGCITSGVIGQRREMDQGAGLSVLVARLPGVTLEPIHANRWDVPALLEDRQALAHAISKHASDGTLRAVLWLADPSSVPMVKLMPALSEAISPVPVVGAMIRGVAQARGNRLLLDGEVLRDGAVGIAISGAVEVQTTVSQGCRPIGQPFVITQSKRHVIQELGGINALAALREMAAKLSRPEQQLLKDKGLQVGRVMNEYKQRFGPGDFLIRDWIGADEKTGFLAIADPQVRVGQTIQFHLHDKAAAAKDLEMMLDAQKVYGPGAGGLLFACDKRGRNLFQTPHCDARAIDQAVGPMPLAGLFASGEIGPVGGASFVHRHAVSLAVFRPLPQET